MTCYWLFGYVQNGSRLQNAGKIIRGRRRRFPCPVRPIGFSRYHPLFLLAGEITLFIPGLQNASVLYNDTESSRESQMAEKFFGGSGEQPGFSGHAAELGEAPFFSSRFGVHYTYLGQNRRTCNTSTVTRGIRVVNKNIALGILLKYMYCFQKISSP